MNEAIYLPTLMGVGPCLISATAGLPINENPTSNFLAHPSPGSNRYEGYALVSLKQMRKRKR